MITNWYSRLNINNKRNYSSIPPKIKKSNILLIGSTGFIGKVLLWMIIQRSDVGKIYILIRPKKGKDGKILSAKDRFEVLKKNPCFNSCVKCKLAFMDGKVVALDGDITKANIGLNSIDLERITGNSSSGKKEGRELGQEEDTKNKSTINCDSHGADDHHEEEGIHHIINLGADIGFQQTLSGAVDNNVTSALNVFNLATICKNLKSFIHCSTAYVVPNIKQAGRTISKNDNVEEERDDHTIIKDNLHTSDNFLENQTAEEVYEKIMSGIEKFEEEEYLQKSNSFNTYTFSKRLAEKMLANKCKGLIPLAIVRPGMVSASLRYPTPGWIDTIQTAHTFITLLSSGIVHTRNASMMSSTLDLVPCDFVCKCILNATFPTDDGNGNKNSNDIKIVSAIVGKGNDITPEDDFFLQLEAFWSNKKSISMLKPFFRPINVDPAHGVRMDIRRLRFFHAALSVVGQKSHANKIKKYIELTPTVYDIFDTTWHNSFDCPDEFEIHDFHPGFNKMDYLHFVFQSIYYFILNKAKEESKDNPRPVLRSMKRGVRAR